MSEIPVWRIFSSKNKFFWHWGFENITKRKIAKFAIFRIFSSKSKFSDCAHHIQSCMNDIIGSSQCWETMVLVVFLNQSDWLHCNWYKTQNRAHPLCSTSSRMILYKWWQIKYFGILLWVFGFQASIQWKKLVLPVFFDYFRIFWWNRLHLNFSPGFLHAKLLFDGAMFKEYYVRRKRKSLF